MISEEVNKGLPVTTIIYVPDAYNFIIELIDGGLLYLLKKIGFIISLTK